MVCFNRESTCYLTDFPASICARKIAARLLDTIRDILRCVSRVQSLLKDRNAPSWRTWNRGVKIKISYVEDLAAKAQIWTIIQHTMGSVDTFLSSEKATQEVIDCNKNISGRQCSEKIYDVLPK